MTEIDSFTLSAVLLAGGQGSRLGGRDKGLMNWRGRPVAEQLAQRLRHVADPVVISCNRNEHQYRQWADALVNDVDPGFPGPLAGIVSALAVCQTSHLLVIPCDVPHLSVELLEDLVARARSQPERVWLIRAGESWQPLISVLPVALKVSLAEAWANGQRSPLRWMLSEAHGVLQVCPNDPRLHNANTPGDWPAET